MAMNLVRGPLTTHHTQSFPLVSTRRSDGLAFQTQNSAVKICDEYTRTYGRRGWIEELLLQNILGRLCRGMITRESSATKVFLKWYVYSSQIIGFYEFHLRYPLYVDSDFQYNNLMYETLSYLPQVPHNQTYESYIAQHIFNPLNMTFYFLRSCQ
jgi:hypothetical protein